MNVRVAWEEPFATLFASHGSSKTRYMELAGLEPATSWVRYRQNQVTWSTFGVLEGSSLLSRDAAFARFGSTDGRSN